MVVKLRKKHSDISTPAHCSPCRSLKSLVCCIQHAALVLPWLLLQHIGAALITWSSNTNDFCCCCSHFTPGSARPCSKCSVQRLSQRIKSSRITASSFYGLVSFFCLLLRPLCNSVVLKLLYWCPLSHSKPLSATPP